MRESHDLIYFFFYSKPSEDVLTEYARRVEFLRGLLEAEKKVFIIGLDKQNVWS